MWASLFMPSAKNSPITLMAYPSVHVIIMGYINGQSLCIKNIYDVGFKNYFSLYICRCRPLQKWLYHLPSQKKKFFCIDSCVIYGTCNMGEP